MIDRYHLAHLAFFRHLKFADTKIVTVVKRVAMEEVFEREGKKGGGGDDEEDESPSQSGVPVAYQEPNSLGVPMWLIGRASTLCQVHGNPRSRSSQRR